MRIEQRAKTPFTITEGLFRVLGTKLEEDSQRDSRPQFSPYSVHCEIDILPSPTILHRGKSLRFGTTSFANLAWSTVPATLSLASTAFAANCIVRGNSPRSLPNINGLQQCSNCTIRSTDQSRCSRFSRASRISDLRVGCVRSVNRTGGIDATDVLLACPDQGSSAESRERDCSRHILRPQRGGL